MAQREDAPHAGGAPPGYVRALGGTTGIDKALKGLTFLASATPGGVPGDRDAYDVTFSNNSDAVTYTSAAGNRSRSDGNGQPDVHQRTMERAYGRRVKGRKVQFLRMDTRLISATPSGAAGNGASYGPAVNTTGSVVAFTTNASNLIGGSNGHRRSCRRRSAPAGSARGSPPAASADPATARAARRASPPAGPG